MDAVGPDQRVANDLAVCAALEAPHHAVAHLPPTDQLVADVDPIRARPIDGRPVQHVLDLAAVDAEHRHVVDGLEASRLVPDRLATAHHGDHLPGADAGPVQGRQQAERRELLDRVRLQVHADAEFAHLGGLLEDLGLDADLVQRQRQRQPADAGPRDRDPHWCTHTILITELSGY